MDPGDTCVLIQRRARPGCEAAFAAALQDFITQSQDFPGMRGVFLVQPTAGGRDWGILRRFASPADRDAFYAAPLFRDWDRRVAPLCEGSGSITTVAGLEAWFGTPGRLVRPPPRWKMAVATLVAVYPLGLLLPPFLRFLTPEWPHPLRALLQSVFIVSALAWVLMPLVTGLLRRWLQSR
jgi:hypothetical protein